MIPVKISKHAEDSCNKRGATFDEVFSAIEHGTRESAKLGRTMCRLNIEFNQIWENKFYSTKQVAPVIVEENNEIVVITVYTYYF